MLQSMVAKTRVRTFLVATVAAAVLAGCGVPPLHRSVVVETNSRGVPVHASGHVAQDRYTVARGDTLYSIAFRAHVDYHQLARWNGISAPYIIHPGQQLRLTRPRDLPPQPAQPAQAPVFHTVTSESTAASPVGTPATGASATGVAVATTAAGVAGEAAGTPASPVSTVVAVAGNPPVAATPQAEHSAPSVPSGATREVGGVTWRWPAGGKLLARFDASDAMPGITIAGNRGDPVRAAADGVVVYSGNGLVGYGELVIIKHSDNYLSAYGHNSKRLVKEGEHVKAGQVIARSGSTGAPRNELEFQVRYKGKPADPLNYLPKRRSRHSTGRSGWDATRPACVYRMKTGATLRPSPASTVCVRAAAALSIGSMPTPCRRMAPITAAGGNAWVWPVPSRMTSGSAANRASVSGACICRRSVTGQCSITRSGVRMKLASRRRSSRSTTVMA